MALPDGFIDDLRSRLVLSDVVARKVVWDARKSNPSKGDFWAPCPFHQEKTASFHVDDRKGYYYCFGCHQKGDAINFVREADNVSFIEAIEILCRDAGVEMPAQSRDPAAQQRRDRQSRLIDVMEMANRFFRLSYRGAGGAHVRAYATSRGLLDETIDRFELGFAPEQRTALTQQFRERNLVDLAVDAGLVIRPDDGGQPYDRFRGRLIFPIRDQRGRCIAFGGRAMAEDARAKYLNSPETDLFHKSRVLYHHGPAREAAGKVGGLIVAEGYMDVIALAQAGFHHTVAPLGTAITAEQLGLMWRIADEPVVALDGDTAGLRAAERLIDVALPLLSAGKTLRFCLMPPGQYPDDLIRSGGTAAMQTRLDGAISMVEMLWRRETEDIDLSQPERRAALDQRLKSLIGRIDDHGVRTHYAADLRQRRQELFAPKSVIRGDTAASRGGYADRSRGNRGFAKVGGRQRPTREAVSSSLAQSGVSWRDGARIREAAILLIAIRNPAAASTLEDRFDGLSFCFEDLGRIRNVLLKTLMSEEGLSALASGEAMQADIDALSK
ncbi:MAG: DNA primase, partial [Pseudomonadota bacterium]